MNVTADDRDVWSTGAWAGKIHCSPTSARRSPSVIAFGLVDLFRQHNPDGGVYSWWDYRGVAFFKNQGLRIDLHLRDARRRRALHRVHDRSQRAQGPGRVAITRR